MSAIAARPDPPCVTPVRPAAASAAAAPCRPAHAVVTLLLAVALAGCGADAAPSADDVREDAAPAPSCLVVEDCAALAASDPCHDRWTCRAGRCEPDAAAAVTCPAPADRCRVAVCAPAAGGCVEQPAADGTACDAADACEIATCMAGRCVAAPRDCDDGDPCTTEDCLAGRGCVSTPRVCDDGDPCTTDGCQPGRGCVSSPLVCDDGDACTDDRCEPGRGCVASPTSCDDGDRCTVDACEPDVGCVAVPVRCEGTDACTVGSCDRTLGCVSAPRDCDDGDACTVDACDPVAGCEHEPVTCAPSSDACLEVTCDPAVGCVAGVRSCDDGDACTVDGCASDSGCRFVAVDCRDDDACTVDTCDPARGCVRAPVVCDDADACTADACDPTVGCVTTPLVCDDGDPCTVDLCDPLLGCLARPVVCNDGDPCTRDACVAETGLCIHEAGPCLPEDRCTDGVDDDGDGDTDCDDADCAEAEVCRAPCVDDDAEDDDLRSTATALVLPAWLSGRVARAGDPDWFRIGVCSGGRLAIEVTATGTGGAPDLILVDAAGAFVAAGQRSAAGVRLDWLSSVDGPVFARIDAAAGSPCAAYGLRVELDARGCGALVEVCDNGRDDDGDGRADCADRDCDAHPACGGGTCVAVGALPCGGAVFGDTRDGPRRIDRWACGGWDESGPEIAWTLTPPGDGAVTVTLSDAAADLDVFVLEGACAPTSCFTYGDTGATFFGVGGRTYHVVVDGAGGAAGSYVLRAECAGRCVDDPLEPNDTAPQARLLRAGEHAAVLAAGSPDWYRVERCRGARLTVTVTAASAVAFDLRLWDAGSAVDAAAAVDGRAALSAVAAADGAWLVELTAAGGPDCADYTLALALDRTGCATETRCTDGVDDDGDGATDCADPDCAGTPACAVGRTCAAPAPVRCGETVTADTRGAVNAFVAYACGADGESGPEHVWALTLAEAGPVTVTLSGMTADLDLFLLAGDCSPGSCVAASTGLSFERFTFQGAAGVPYFVVVDGYEGAAGAYALTVDAESCQSPCEPDCGDRVCGPDPVCGSSCGACADDETCAAGRCRPARCEGLPDTGCCDGATLVWCDEGTTRSEECAAGGPPADVCGWSAAASYVACGGRDTPPPGVERECPVPCAPTQTCAALGRVCGAHPECPERTCGACAAGRRCEAGQCVPCDVAVACAGIECGPGDCGIDCGGCGGGDVCVLGACAAPGSRSCATPAPLACGETRRGDTVGGLALLSTYACAPVDEPGVEDVYTLTMARDSVVTLTLATAVDLDLFVLAQVCDGAACVAGAAGPGAEEVWIEARAGETYYVVVESFGAESAAYTLTATCE
jgi:hypothetical protein